MLRQSLHLSNWHNPSEDLAIRAAHTFAFRHLLSGGEKPERNREDAHRAGPAWAPFLRHHPQAKWFKEHYGLVSKKAFGAPGKYRAFAPLS